MGTLKEGASYIYESPDGGKSIFARESGTNERIFVGGIVTEIEKRKEEEKLWNDILELARTNEILKSELDRVIVVYYLVKENQPPVAYHPI